MARRTTSSRTEPGRKFWPIQALFIYTIIIGIMVLLVAFTGNKSFSSKLGIDLQGGTRVTLVPQGDRPSADQLAQARTILENRVNGMGVSGAEVVADGSNLVITVPGDDASEARSLGKTSQLLFRAVSDPILPGQDFPTVLGDMANRWVEVGLTTPEEAQARIDQVAQNWETLGITEPPAEPLNVTAKNPAPAATDLEEQERREAQLSVMLEDRQSTNPSVQNAASVLLTCGLVDPLAGADDAAKPLVACSPQGPMLLEPAPLLSGETDTENGKRLTGNLIDTNSQITGGFDPNSAQMAITFRFKTGAANPGGETWYALGQQQLNKQVAIVLDSQVISAPQIITPTPPGEISQITGQFTEQEATELANNLRYGALPISFTGANGEPGGTTQTISATLGSASLQAGLIAGLVGLALVALYSLFYYRGLGLVALVSLVAAFAMTYLAIVLLGRWIGYSLDLAGIAGLIIGIGTTADSFVIYFERIKDEIKNGGTFRSSVPRAWDRAKNTIITGNIVSLIAAVILYFLAIGDVKGFAFTLGLTTIFDIVVAFLVTAPLVILASRKPALANPRINGLGSAFREAERQYGRKVQHGGVFVSDQQPQSVATATPAAISTPSVQAATEEESQK